MRLTVLGACGAWPRAGEACSGYLVEHDGFSLLLDVGYAVVPRLSSPDRVDAVFITHGHPDHCADLNPLLRARALGDGQPPSLPVHALPGAIDAVLALDRPGMLDAAVSRRDVVPGERMEIGPFQVETRLLPHWEPNAGVRLSAGGRVLAYTGDSGPSPDVVGLARDADLLLAEATYADQVPEQSRRYLSTAAIAGAQAAQAGVGRLLLTHLWPGTGPQAALTAAAGTFAGATDVAVSGLTFEVG